MERHDHADQSRIALTFDDGPSPLTPVLLDVLRSGGARATFFVLGRAVAGREGILRRAVAEGHELGNHLFTHIRASRLTDAQLRDELVRTQEVVRAAAGIMPRAVRPPYGDDAGRVASVAEPLGLTSVLWSSCPFDWEGIDAGEIVRRVVHELEPGTIVLLHDGRRATRATVEATRSLLAHLSAEGFQSVTVSEL
jgi:peptidoglycan/xylan/chitin deacetylase (PgdA/CDA1 family)